MASKAIANTLSAGRENLLYDNINELAKNKHYSSNLFMTLYFLIFQCNFYHLFFQSICIYFNLAVQLFLFQTRSGSKLCSNLYAFAHLGKWPNSRGAISAGQGSRYWQFQNCFSCQKLYIDVICIFQKQNNCLSHENTKRQREKLTINIAGSMTPVFRSRIKYRKYVIRHDDHVHTMFVF